MRKMRSFLGCLVSLIIIVFSANALAEGYSCPSQKQYTTCNSGYYLTSNSAGNSCSLCSGQKSSITDNCTIDCTSQKSTLHATSVAANNGTKTCTGNFKGGSGGSTVGTSSCTGCSQWGSCTGSTCYATACESGYYFNNNSCTSCTTLQNTSQVSSESISHGTRVQTCTGHYTGGAGGTYSSSSCSGCDTSTYTCNCDLGYYSSGSGGNCTCVFDTKTCSAGQYLNSSGDCTSCPNGYYCPGGTFDANGGEQGLNNCPSGTTGSSGTRNALGTCYKTCPEKTTNNGTVRPAQQNVSPDSATSYPDCKYYVDCDAGYKAVNDNSTNPSCSQCSTGKWCSNSTENNCPQGYTSSAGASAQSDCYRSCTASDISNSKTVTGNVPHPGTDTSSCIVSECVSGYFITDNNEKSCTKCPANSTDCAGTDVGSGEWNCQIGYTKQGNECVADSDTWSVTFNYNCDTTYSTCNSVHFGPATSKADLNCTPTCTGYTFQGWFTLLTSGTKVTCVTGMASGGDPSCQVSQDDYTVYAHWTKATETCQSGKYYNGSSHVSCSDKTGYYCPGTGTATVGQKGCYTQCPENFQDGVDSPYSAATNCYHSCPAKSDNNANSVTAQKDKINYPGNSMTPTCTYTADCKAGFKPQNQNSANASCVKCETSENCPGGTSDPEKCPDGYTCSGGSQEECTEGNYCTGGESHTCPQGYTSSKGAKKDTDCYKSCSTSTTANGTIQAEQNKVNYPSTCSYNVTCNEGYKPSGQGTENASCVSCSGTEYCPQGNTGSETCPDGYTCSGGGKEECPANSYCTGGESHTCPDGGKTDGAGKSSITDCYKECTDKQTSDIPHSTSVTTDKNKVYYSGSSYPACTYTVECDNRGDIKYKPFGNGTSNPTCVWDNGSGCPAGYYCPPDSDPQQCPNGGYADASATQITDCHKEVDPYTDWEHGTGSATCYYNTESQDYNSRCDNGKAKTCEAGYYYGTQGSLACQSVGNGYYSPANDTDRKECPTGYSGSSENASSYTDCYKNCTLSVPNSSTVTPKQPRVNADSASSYPQCTFTVVCNTGYTVQNNDTANPTCDANKFTVTLDKNGGSGSVSDNVQCTIGQNCNLLDASSLTRAGYTNDNKWCTTNSGGTPCYDGGSSVAASTLSAGGTDITLYAKWTPNIYTVNLDDQNSDDPHATASVPHTVYLKFATGWFNEKAATTTIEKLTTLPTKNGYTFSGFSTQKSGGTQVINNTGNFDKGQSALTSITSDNATIYAQWANGTTTCPEGTYYDGTPECKSCPEGYYCTGGEYGTGGGEQGKNECPDNGTAPANSTSETQCYKTVDYTATHGSGTQTCNYNSESHKYDKDCKDKKIEKCNGGYYLSSTDKIDCDEAGMNYYSGENEKERHQCPNESKTKGTTESSITACYKNVPYEATYGSGTQDCFYTSGNDSNAVFATSCENKRIDKCWAGYYRLTETDEDCTIAAQNYYSEKDDVEQHPCPDNGTTESEGTTSQTLCRLDNLPYNKENGKCEHCDGHQRCYYNPQDKKYTNNCNTPTIEQCDAGYWFNESQKTSDCVEAGIGYWSPEEDLTRHQCEVPGTTDSKTSTSASDCYNPNTVCDVENGTGKHKCNWGTNAYDVSCTACVVTSCNMGYSQSGDKCEECPEGYFCGGGETGEDGGKEKCPSDYPNTSAGASSKNDCYKNCTMGANATEMSGGVYYDGQNTCKITKCNKGYTLQNGVCVLCPAGSFCDGTGGGDGGETGDVKSCADLGNAYDNPLTKWQYAEQGADEATDCYAKCENYTVGYGTAIADNPTVHYPTQCTYHGESETGNPCELVGEGENAQCVEKSCKGNFEMIDGKCTLCKREHALSYRAEGNCLIASCEAGYHSAETSCVEDVVECEAPNATSAEQTWDRQTRAFSKCTIKVCDEGYHLASNACVPNEQTCTLDHGHGYMEWDIKKNAWGDCIATHCDPGYTNDPSMNYEPNKQCGHCKNKFAQLGELAVDGYKKGEQVVSSYTTECEIAACMYQGELYDLQGNECIPICTPYTDATGTRKRVGNECERTCNDGYMSW